MTEWFINVLRQNGIDPLYASTALAILACLGFYDDYGRWGQLSKWYKQVIISAVATAAVLATISIFRIFGVLRF